MKGEGKIGRSLMGGFHLSPFVLIVALVIGLMGVGLFSAYREREYERAVARREYTREAEKAARSILPNHFATESRPVFLWRPEKGLSCWANMPKEVVEALSSTNIVWQAIGRKTPHPRVGYMVLDGHTIAWRLSQSAIVGGIIPPFVDPPLHLMPLILALAILLPAAYLSHRAAREALEKRTFLSNVSHELKTPLAAISLWCDLAQNPQQREKALRIIASENAHMIELIENLLSLTRRHIHRYHFAEIDLAALTDEIVAHHQASFPNGLTCQSTPLTFRTDSTAFRRILDNLLSNALKYAAAKGPVSVQLAASPTEITLTVTDSGPGLSPTALRHIFDRFYRADNALTATTRGLGLGLSLARDLARDLGGELTAENRSCGGCVFTLKMKR